MTWLARTYGSISAAARATGLSESLLRRIKNGHYANVRNDVAARVVEVVLSHKHGTRDFSTYENDGAARFATPEEREEPQSFVRWRPAGQRAIK